ncbi:hypothetical protein QBC45DRAFT_6637 [Copromyces sp. CBS 386.78]|nr:hypothetical protein QBC45DRAFT_6637 [Copromyces sp. CBS 386.78]
MPLDPDLPQLSWPSFPRVLQHIQISRLLSLPSWHLLGSCFFAFKFTFPCPSMFRCCFEFHDSSCTLRPHPQNVCHLHISVSPFSPQSKSPFPISAKLQESTSHPREHKRMGQLQPKPSTSQEPRGMQYMMSETLQSINVAVASRRMAEYIGTKEVLFQPSPIPKAVGVLDMGNLKKRGTEILRGSHQTTRQARHALILYPQPPVLYTRRHARKSYTGQPPTMGFTCVLGPWLYPS